MHFVLETITFVLEMNTLKKLTSSFSRTHTASYQWLPNRSYIEMIDTHMYSPPKTGGITLILTSKHATPTSCISSIQFANLPWHEFESAYLLTNIEIVLPLLHIFEIVLPLLNLKLYCHCTATFAHFWNCTGTHHQPVFFLPRRQSASFTPR